MVECSTEGARNQGLEVREGGSARLLHSTVSGCQTQGVLAHRRAAKVVVEDSTIKDCGNSPHCGAIMLCSGMMVLRRVRACANRGDGIVIEDEDGSANVNMEECRVLANARSGMKMYGGRANIRRTCFEANALTGFDAQGRNVYQVLLQENRFSNNSPRKFNVGLFDLDLKVVKMYGNTGDNPYAYVVFRDLSTRRVDISNFDSVDSQ